MMYPGFCGGSFTAQSPLVDCERTMNLYPEQRQVPGQHGDFALYPVGGFSSFVSVSDVGTRAMWSDPGLGRCFAVVGPSLYEIFSGRTATFRGTVANDGNLATISYNGAAGGQLFICSGTNGYSYTLSSNTLAVQLTGEATMGGMVDGYFLAFNIANGKVRLSNLNDGTTWAPLQFFQNSLTADPWQTMQIRNGDVILIGTRTGQVWRDQGAFPVPFQPFGGVIFQYGVLSTFAAGINGQTVTWLSQNTAGQGIVVTMPGYVPSPVSTTALENIISGYARNFSISDVEFITYQDAGHPFDIMQFPSVPATWGFDEKSQLWHERGYWSTTNGGQYMGWKPRVHANAFGLHLTGDRSTGTIAIFDQTYTSELDGSAVRRMRIPPPIWANSRTQSLDIARFEVLYEEGIGSLGLSPVAMMRASYNTKTWGTLRTATTGSLGQYGARTVWNRCGQSRNLWVPEVTMTDPYPWRIVGADVEGNGFAQQQAA